ncbi:hypothetical protein E2542_SST15348 [Spatholobus suberectus]|nr:hypothetical protein E2542_SST15348 [Spatholobus suberectus]
MELRSMNSYIDLTLDVEESDQGSFDDTTKEVVDKMAMSLPNVENEIVEATRKDTNAADMKLASMKICIDLTTDDEESNQDSLDDITIEVAEIMAKSLPDVENVNRDLKNSSQNDETVEVAERMPKSLPNVDNVNYSMMKNSSPKEKHPAIDGENGTTTRGENVFPRSGISINNFSFGGNSFGMNNLHSTQSSSGFGLSPSSGVHISPMDSNQLGHAQTSMFEVNSIGINNLQSAQSPFGFGLLPSSGVHISPMDIRHLGQAQTSMFDANSSGINNLHSAQSPFGFGLLPSTGVHISPVDTGQIGPAQTSMFKLGMREFGSSNTSLHVQGYGNATCNIAKPLPLNNAFLTPPLIVSHPPDMISLSSGSLNKQSKEREFDLNIPYSADTNQVRPSSKTSVEYPFSSQHNWTEHHPNQRVSFDLNANDTTPDINLLSLDPAGMKLVTSLNARSSDQMLKRTPNPGECLNTKLDIGKSKTYDSPEGQLSDSHKKSYLSDKSHGPTIFGRKLIGPSDLGDRNMTVSGQEKMSSSCSFMQNQKKLFGWPDLEEEEETPPQHCSARETPALLNDTSERWCEMNRNPAEFSPVEPGNPYMMDKEDKVEKTVRKKRCGSSSKQKRR